MLRRAFTVDGSLFLAFPSFGKSPAGQKSTPRPRAHGETGRGPTLQGGRARVMVKVSMRSAEAALVDEATPLKQHAELHPPAPRSAAIDGLRPLLALRVVLGHVSEPRVADSEPGYDSIRLFWTAAETSFVYFVLSGFVQGRSSRPHPVGHGCPPSRGMVPRALPTPRAGVLPMSQCPRLLPHPHSTL